MLTGCKICLQYKLFLLSVFILCVGGTKDIYSQNLNDAEVKTALLYNFLKYIEGESIDNADTIFISYLGEDQLLSDLIKNLNNQKVKGKKISINELNDNQNLNKTDIIFVFNEYNFDVTRIYKKIQNTRTFIITDRYSDQREIMINFIHVDGKVQFEINKKNIIDAGFTISSKLLLLGGTEVDVRQLYRETERTLFQERERIEKIQQELLQKQEEVEGLVLTLSGLFKKNDSLNTVLKNQINTITEQEEKIDSLQNEYNVTVSEVNSRKIELNNTNWTLSLKNSEIKDLDDQLNLKQKNLEEASSSLEKLKTDIQNKEALLIDQQNQIRLQRVAFFIFVIFFILFIAFIIYIYINNKANIRKNKELENRNAKINTQKEKIQLQANKLSQTNSELEKEKKKAQDALQRLKNAQSQLVAAEKMVSLGQLTSGIAHEINNPINYISSNIEGLRNILDDFKQIIKVYDNVIPQENAKEIDDIKEELEYEEMLIGFDELTSNIKLGVDRTKEIVNSLRTFARVDNDEFVLTDLHQTIDSSIILMGKQSKNQIEIIKQYGNIHEVECSPGKLSQVFMNILVNAVHAIEKDGKIIISTSETEKNNKRYVLIGFKDNGCGIKPEIVEKIFEPFFTTKDVGEGTGLGLSISYSIVKKHNGFIEVETEENKGTEFKIFLPFKNTNK